MDSHVTGETPVRIRQKPEKGMYRWTISGHAGGPEPYRANTPEQKRSVWGAWVEHKKLMQLRERMKCDDAE